jgi:hypothetical protein
MQVVRGRVPSFPLVVVLSLCLLWSDRTLAQAPTGTIEGTVTDRYSLRMESAGFAANVEEQIHLSGRRAHRAAIAERVVSCA